MVNFRPTLGPAALLSAFLITAGAFSQAFADGSFESQPPGTSFVAPWMEANGAESYIENNPSHGFPTQGSNCVHVGSDLTGIYGLGCNQHPAYVGAWVSQLFGSCFHVTSIGLDWTWINHEQLNEPTYNDFMAIRLYNGNGGLLATMVYVDTRDGTGTLAPECPSAGVTLPLNFVNGEVAPIGPKHATLDLSTVPGYTPGMPLELVILVANRGDAAMPSFGLVDNITVGSSPLNGPGQPNSAHARLEINGAGGGTCNGPFTFSIPGGANCTFTFQGDPNQPFAMFASGAQHPTGTSYSCFGALGIGTPPHFYDLVLAFDGTIPGSPFVTDNNGSAIFVAWVPPGPFNINLQALVFRTPGSGCLISMSAALYAYVQ